MYSFTNEMKTSEGQYQLYESTLQGSRRATLLLTEKSESKRSAVK